MTANARKTLRTVPSSGIAARVQTIDWAQAESELDAQGCAVLKGLLAPGECRALAALYPDDRHFRSRIVMGRHGFGRGEYKYFSYPLPEVIAELRPALYARLTGIANRWNEAMGIDIRYPEQHEAFLQRMAQFQERHRAGDLTLSLKVMETLRDWIVEHVQSTDKRYGPALSGKGIA